MKKTSLDELPAVAVSHNPDISKKVMLDRRAVPGLTNFSQAVLRHGQVAPGHAHEDMFEVFFVRRGRGKILVEGAEHDVGPGECILIEPGEFHEVRNACTEDLVLLYFGLERTGQEVKL